MNSVSQVVMAEVEPAIRDNPDAIVAVADSRGIFVYLSPTVAQLGYTPEEGLGRSFLEFYDPVEGARVELALRDVIVYGYSAETVRIINSKNGEKRRMRGVGTRLIDPKTGEIYVLSLSWLED